LANAPSDAAEESTNSAIRLLASASLTSLKLVIERLMFSRRSASAPPIRFRSRASGSKRRRPAESSSPRPPRPLPAAWSRSWRYARVSPSSVSRISSGCTFGSVCETGIVVPSSTGSPSVPGSSETVMSWRPVRGRSSIVASSWISGA
jgi:hypothetical protein